MSGLTGAEAVPGMTSKDVRPICNTCAPPHIDRHKCAFS